MADVTDNQARRHFELAIDGHIATCQYSLQDGVISFIHSAVPEALAGKGIGSKLIKGALDQVRARRQKVIALCPFVKATIEKHPEYAELLK